MVEETIRIIKEAERQADELVKEAEARCSEMRRARLQKPER